MEIIHKGIPPCAFREDKGSGGQGVELHTTGGLILYFCLLVAPYINEPVACEDFDLKNFPPGFTVQMETLPVSPKCQMCNQQSCTELFCGAVQPHSPNAVYFM